MVEFVLAEGVRHGGTEEQPWFVTADVCHVMRIKDPGGALGDLPADCKAVHAVPTPDGLRPLPVLTESGLYALALRSDRAEAVAFAKWLCKHLLPDLVESEDLSEKLRFLSGVLGAPFEVSESLPRSLPPEDLSAN